MQLEGIDHVALAVRDIERSVRWYTEVLGFEKRYEEVWNGVPTFVAKGSTALALFPMEKGDPQAHQLDSASGMLHLAFRADAGNFAAAQRELKHRDIEFEFQDHEISHSIYFCDPDGHKLEITTYEL